MTSFEKKKLLNDNNLLTKTDQPQTKASAELKTIHYFFKLQFGIEIGETRTPPHMGHQQTLTFISKLFGLG